MHGEVRVVALGLGDVAEGPRILPEQVAAVSTFSGRWTEDSYERHVESLRLNTTDRVRSG